MARHTTTAWFHIRRSPYQALAAILIMMVTFLTISVFTILIFGSQKVISYFESKPQVTAFFQDTASQNQIDALESQVQATGKVSSIKFISKQQALDIYKEQNKNDPLLLELVTADILPASLEISTYSIDDLPLIATAVKNSPIVQEVVFQKDVVNTLTTWTSAIRKIGIALIVILGLVSVFIMVTIIGIKISQKRDEIEIMRLIGATDWYISFPFVYEGIFYAIIGAFVGWFIASGALLYMTPFLETFLKGIPVLPVSPLFFLELLGGEILLAVLLGSVSSMIAVSRYLR